MQLITALLRRAAIPTPVADAQDYCARRATDNAALGDIRKLPYIEVTPIGRKLWINGKGDNDSYIHGRLFNTEIEARAFILQRFW